MSGVCDRGHGRTTETTTCTSAADLGWDERISRRRKRGAMLRLLRGDYLELVSHLLGVLAAMLSSWRDAFLAASKADLAALAATDRRAAAARPTRADARCGAVRGDPGRHRRKPLPRREPPQGVNPIAHEQHTHLPAPGHPADGRGLPARTLASRLAAASKQPRRHHHFGCGGRDVAHRATEVVPVV